MNELVKVIGNYIPRQRRPRRQTIGRDLGRLIRAAGFQCALSTDGYGREPGMLEVRSPAKNWRLHQVGHGSGYRRSDIRRFHHDAGGEFEFIILWAWPEPTELRLAGSRRTVTYNPGDLLLVNNRKVLHRMPKEIGSNRWFARMLNPVAQ